MRRWRNICPMGPRQMVGVGAVLAFLGVAAGAFGAHALRDQIPPDRLAIYQTGAQYQLVHALALLGIAASPLRDSRRTGWLFLIGVFVFSGSLYALAITGIPWLGAITPLGGLSFLAGWALLAWDSFRQPRS